MKYTPKPILLDDLGIPAEVFEEVAKNVHEMWAAGRMADGWRLGERNDAERTTPCLVPFEELPEEEREYDRTTARATLSALLSQGYKLVKTN